MALSQEKIRQLREQAGMPANLPTQDSINAESIIAKRKADLGLDQPEATTGVATPSYIKDVSQEQISGAQKIKSSIEKGAQSFRQAGEEVQQKPFSALFDTAKGIAQAGFGTISGASQIAFSPVTPALSKVVEKITPVLREQNPELAKVYDTVVPKLDEWAKAHPESAELAGDVLNTVLLGVGGTEGPAIAKTSTEALSKKIVDVRSGLKAKNVLRDAKSVDELAGKIVQGEKSDIETAKKALHDIDVTDIKTYEDLRNTLNEKVGNLSRKLDEKLEQSPVYNKPLQLRDWEKMTKVGDQTVSTNYVEQALQQMKEHFTKINDIENATKVQQLITKGETDGLTIKEVNNIARMHGETLNAYNANGQLASGLTKQAVENTRKGVKETVRENFGDKVAKSIDEEISKSIRVRDLAKDMAEKVNELKQRITNRTFGEKVGRLAFQAIDLLSGGSISGFVRSAIVPRGAGLKILNALDLEAQLNKNLLQLKKALTATEESEAIGALKTLIKDNQSRELPTSQLNTNSAANTAKNVPIEANSTIGSTVNQVGDKSLKKTKGLQGGFIKNPFYEGTKITPSSVAKKIDETDSILIDNYLRNSNLENFNKIAPILEDAKLVDEETNVIKNFLKEVMDEKAKVAERKIIKRK